MTYIYISMDMNVPVLTTTYASWYPMNVGFVQGHWNHNVAVGLPIAVYGTSDWSNAASPAQKPNYAKDAILLPAMQGTRYRVCASSLFLVLLSYAVCVCVSVPTSVYGLCVLFCLWTMRPAVYVCCHATTPCVFGTQCHANTRHETTQLDALIWILYQRIWMQY